MISRLTREYLDAFRRLDPEVQRKVQRAYDLFKDNPRHGSLQFKRVKGTRNRYSARVDDNFRVLGELNGNTITWRWVGPHDEYDRMIP